ncbi:polysaccharide deacetylase family protein [Streptomyces piniterrae]|uniref:Polysaccharide deacetylase family protein n=1 Tax=Streptomyces piniterrae TaxID=2571125 RepID=A0A4U0NW05_9ACTN|nr:polysaccharide deacetylase family protein [Streptomyces piniterrae]TJZ58927.1 polysaccharide deacetylase family protein [Streptomyces piniterrae]
MSAVPVFVYHSVSTDPPEWIAPYTVTPRVFAEHLDRIADAGLTVVPLRRLVAAMRGGPPLPTRSAVLTFDDGFADFYWSVTPLLTDRQVPATVYITTGVIHPPGGSPEGSLLPPAPMLSWRQIATLDALGFEIGGHSVTHAQLDTLSAEKAWHEIVDNKRRLEDVLSHPVYAFAYPHGYSSAAVRRTAREAGWTSACAVRNAFSSVTDEPMRIARLMVRADTSPERFTQWTLGMGAPAAPLPESLQTKGYRLYRRARALLGRPVEGPPGPGAMP